MARQNRLKARQRHTISVFGREQHRQKPSARIAFRQNLRGWRRNDRSLLALGATVMQPDMAQHADLHRHDVELFAHFLANNNHWRAALTDSLVLG